MSEAFSDLLHVISSIDMNAGDAAQLHIREQLAQKPLQPDGGAVDSIAWLAASQITIEPKLDETHLCLLATSYEKSTPVAAVRGFCERAQKGAAPVNLLCVDDGLGMRVLDLAVELPHRVMEWQDSDVVAATAYGMEAVAAGGDLLGLADIGMGNQAYALATFVGVMRELGQDMEAPLLATEPPIREQAASLIAALEVGSHPLEVLRLIGGRDIAAALGALVAARSVGLPVLIEGCATLAATAILHSLDSRMTSHIRLAGCNDAMESAMAKVLDMHPYIGRSSGAGPGSLLALATRIIRADLQLINLRDIPKG